MEKSKLCHFGDDKLLKYPFEKKINFDFCPPKRHRFEGKKERKKLKKNLWLGVARWPSQQA
jgi:hypothetical protein